MANKPKTKGLGRGLSALLADVDTGSDEPQSGASKPASRRSTDVLPIEQVRANPEQPRRQFSQKDMDDLTASIREKGIIQPLIVRPDPHHEGDYQIVAGERRWRAAQNAQLHEIPVLIRDLSDTEVLELAIIENIQRADLNAIEEAVGFKQLMDRFGHTQEKLAEALGKSRSHIANLLRLLNLPDDVLEMVRDARLSAGHARALVPAEDPSALAREVLSKGLSVRQTEALAKSSGGRTAPASKRRDASGKDADTRAVEADLSAQLRMPVTISPKAGTEGGDITIRYRDLDQLDSLLQLLAQ